MRVFRWMLAAVTLALNSFPAIAQCPGGRCGRPAPVCRIDALPTSPAAYIWKCEPGSNVFGLFRGGVQVGAWTPDLGYRVLAETTSGDYWSAACEPPAELPGIIAQTRCKCNRDCHCGFGCDCYRRGACSAGCNCARRESGKKAEAKAATAADECIPGCPCGHEHCNCGSGGPCSAGCMLDSAGHMNFGVALDKIADDGACRYSLSGRRVSRDEALAAVGGKVPDDAKKPFVTVIGTKEARQAVLADLDAAPALAGVKDKVRLQAYDPQDWAVSRYGFATSGTPTVYVQDASGKVLHRQDDYAGGAVALAAALRRAVPDYQPQADPDARQAQPAPGPSLPGGVPWSVPVGATVAGAALLATWPRRKTSPIPTPDVK